MSRHGNLRKEHSVTKGAFLFTGSQRRRLVGPELARPDLRRWRYQFADKTSPGHPGVRLSRQLGELPQDLSVTGCVAARGSEDRRLRNGESSFHSLPFVERDPEELVSRADCPRGRKGEREERMRFHGRIVPRND